MRKLKKLFIFSIALTLFTSIFLTPTYANSVNSPAISTSSETSLRDAKQLSKSEVLTIVKSHIANYMKNDNQTKGKNITPSSNFINLYDLNGNLFAYVVPLLENGKEELGYITVGAVEDGYNAYEISIDPNALKNLKSELSVTNKLSEKKIVYIPPFSYVLSVKENNENKYYDLSTKNLGKDITDQIKKYKPEIENIHNRIRSEKNKNQIKKILSNSIEEKPIINSTTPYISNVATVTEEDVRLVNEASFLPIWEIINFNYIQYYGGNQNWYDSVAKQNNGCGPTAAANITAYLARKSSTSYGSLYSPSGLSKNEFLTHMDALYTILDPSLAGEYTLTGFRNDVKTFASFRGVALTDSYNDCSDTIDNVANFIKYGLLDDSPVACLNRQPAGYTYGWHWMTITKYFRDVNDNKWIAISTWGQRQSIDFTYYYDSTHAYGGGFVYFN